LTRGREARAIPTSRRRSYAPEEVLAQTQLPYDLCSAGIYSLPFCGASRGEGNLVMRSNLPALGQPIGTGPTGRKGHDGLTPATLRRWGITRVLLIHLSTPVVEEA